MIFTTHLFLQWLEYFRAAQNSCELLGGKKQGIFGVWVTNQSASWVLSTDLVYAYYYYCYCKTLHDMSTDRVRLKKLFTSKIVQPSRPCFYYSGKDLWKRYWRNTCTHFLFHNIFFFKMVHISIARDLGKEIYR